MFTARLLLRRHLRLLAPSLLPTPPRAHPNPLPSSRPPHHPSNPQPSIPTPSLRPFSSHAPDGGAGALDALPVDGGSGESLWYAPVRGVISLLDGYHDLTGLPWWVVIATSTLALRMSLLPVLIVQFKKVGKFSELFPKLPPPLPPPHSGKSFREQLALHRMKRKELGCPSYLWNFAYFSIQFPCFLLWMTSIRRMSLDGHSGFEHGGALWFQNLSEFPHGICGPVFPILVAGLHFINVQISFRTFKVAKLPGLLGLLARYYKLYLDILSLPLLVIGFYIPQGSLVYWVTNSTLTLAQQLLIRNPDIRQKLGLPAINVKMENKTPSRGQTAPINRHPSISSILNSESMSKEHPITVDEIKSLPPHDLLEQGLQQIASGNQDNALVLLKLASEKDSDLVKALIAIGQILCSRKLLVEAAEYFERAISKIQKDDEIGLLVLALFGAGVSHIWEGKSSEGVEYLKRISELQEPEAPMDKACYYQGLVMLGSELFKQGKKAEAATYLRRAAAYDSNVEAYVKECEEGLEENNHEPKN